MEEIRIRHEDELRQLEEAHLAEMNLFTLEWQKQINDFNNEIDRMLGELSQKHEKQMVSFRLSREMLRTSSTYRRSSTRVRNCWS